MPKHGLEGIEPLVLDLAQLVGFERGQLVDIPLDGAMSGFGAAVANLAGDLVVREACQLHLDHLADAGGGFEGVAAILAGASYARL